MTRHAQQIASVLHRAVQTVIRDGLNDPRVRGLVSVTRIEVAEDLGDATVFVSVFPTAHEELTMHGLRHAGPHIRSRVGRIVDLRRVPRLTIKLDRTIKKAARLDAALRRDDEAVAPSPEGQEPDP